MRDHLSSVLGTAWARNLDAHRLRVAVQESAIVAALGGTLDAAARELAGREAHKLAGSLGSFGLTEGSRLATELEAAWTANGTPDIARLAQAIVCLRRQVEAHVPVISDAPGAEVKAATNCPDVLLIDDDEIFADFVSETLRPDGREVCWFADGESARAAVCGPTATLQPRLILLDVEMPRLDGFAVLESMVRWGVPRQTAVVMLTRRRLTEDIVRARRLGVVDYLAKPLEAPTLVQRVNRLLNVL